MKYFYIYYFCYPQDYYLCYFTTEIFLLCTSTSTEICIHTNSDRLLYLQINVEHCHRELSGVAEDVTQMCQKQGSVSM